MHKKINAKGTADILLRRLFPRFGIPDKIISDRGPQFAAKAFRDLCRLLGIKSTLSTAYHPQTDGATERVNQEIEAYLSTYCTSNPDTWSAALPIIEFTHNSRAHAGRTATPFELIMGTKPKALPEVFQSTRFPSNEERIRWMGKARLEALAAHELGRAHMIERSNRNWKPFEVGQKVWLEAKNLNLPYRTKKIAPKRLGPFQITDKIGNRAYRLQLPKQWQIHNVFHSALLSAFNETDAHGPAFPRPPPDIINDEEEVEVETIIRHRKHRKGYQYLIHYKGYPTGEDEYVLERDLKNAKTLLNTYKRKNGLLKKNLLTKKKA